MKRATKLAVVIGIGLLCAGLAASAGAKIEPQVGIGGFDLKMSVAKVLKKHGEPDKDRLVDDPDVGPQRELHYGKTTALFAGAEDDAKLIGVISKDRGERTDGGSGIGTSEEDLLIDLPRLRCEQIDRERHCYLGKLKQGQKVTDFAISKAGRVNRVTIAVITD